MRVKEMRASENHDNVDDQIVFVFLLCEKNDIKKGVKNEQLQAECYINASAPPELVIRHFFSLFPLNLYASTDSLQIGKWLTRCCFSIITSTATPVTSHSLK